MKRIGNNRNKPLWVSGITLFLGLLLTQAINAQFNKLFEFEADENNNMQRPQYGQLVNSGSTLFGLVCNGGNYNCGVIFRINADGSGYQKMYDFGSNNGTNPYGSLLIVGDSLYGMTRAGGNSYGVIFRIHMNGTGYQKLFDFDSNSGVYPYGSLTLAGDSLYGMTSAGGFNGYGTIFKIGRNGTGFKNLLDFSGSDNGRNPYGSLTLVGDSLYGMTYRGGTNNVGVIFKINKSGAGYQKLFNFDGANSGSYPYASLELVGDSLYGTTNAGGTGSVGVVFKIHRNGTGYNKIHDFVNGTNGYTPFCSLELSGDSLYGTARNGGSNYEGVIFKIHKNGSGYQKIFSFDGGNGARPYGSLFLAGGSLYGMTNQGGTSYNGVIFKINPDGSGYTKLKDCFVGSQGYNSNSVITNGTYLYGMTQSGGTLGYGVLFRTNMDGSGFQKILDFDGISSGATPYGSLSLIGDSLYGMTNLSGIYNRGAIFKVHINGFGFQKLYDFNYSEGGNPRGNPVLIGDSLYGVTDGGGSSGIGTIFKIHRNGSGYQKIFDFNGTATGSTPIESLILISDSLYGTTSLGGSSDLGVIFKIHRNGSGFKKLHDFTGLTTGSRPYGLLTLLRDSLYGLTYLGGSNDVGVIFKIHRNGTGFKKLIDFDNAAKGANPATSLTLLGNKLYGTTNQGGANGYGVFFSYKPEWNTFIKIRDFNSETDGANPKCILLSHNTALYGTCQKGGADGMGTIFKYVSEVTLQANNVQFSNVLASQMDISFTPGDGDFRAVFMYQGSSGTPTINNGTTYTASNIFGSGTQAGTGWYCVANGSLNGSVTVTGLSPLTTYRVMVVEYNGTSGSENYLTSIAYLNPNNQATIAKQNQTITFAALPTKKYGDADLNPGATASSGLPVSYASSNTNVATIVDGMIHIIGVGASNITASQSGNNNYNAAPDSIRTLTVYKADQSVSFAALPVKSCGDADFNPGATASSGLTVGYTSSNTSVATIVGGMIHIVGAGTSNITASQAGNNNYNPAPDSIQVLTVNKLAQTLTFPTFTGKTVGDADFDPGAIASSGLPVTYASSNTAVVTVVSGMIHIVGLGSATITAYQTGNSMYNEVSLARVLTVKANQTITFNAFLTKTYGDGDFNPGATTSSGLAVTYTSSNTNVATIVSGNIHIVGAGTTDITASQAGNNDFNAATNIIQTLTVNKATLTVTADNKTRKAGEANPIFTITYSGWIGTDNADVLDTKPAIDCSATTSSTAGTYNITVSGGSDNNYSFTYVNGTLTVESNTAINKSVDNNIEIYPVPAKDKLYLKIPGGTAVVFITDMSGHVVMTEKITSKTETIDVSTLAKGIYTLKLTFNNSVFVKKIEVR